MENELNIDVEEIEHKIILRLFGRLDAQTSLILEKQIENLVKDGRTKLFLDFSFVDYLSSAGMRLLLSYSKKLKLSQGKFVLFSLSEEVMEIIKLAGFEHVLTICQNEKEALIEKHSK
ncbi:MAG: STAS domain-containing protein [Chlamydiae bacterium]|nr:STAS domain-containing protein [Chlamydiota bacterium]